MSRGRCPLNAIDDAVEIANSRGSVEEVTGKQGRAFDFIIIEPNRNVFEKVKRAIVNIYPGYPAPLPARDRKPSPSGLNKCNRPGILDPVQRRDMAVFPDPARFRPGDPG